MRPSKLLLFLLMLVGCTVAKSPKAEPQEQAPKPSIPAGRVYVQRVMTACNANLSAARREILAEQIRVVGEAFFAKKEERRWYYFLICIESKFQNEARSPVGAVGLTQVMPKYASEFAKACQLGALEPKDLNDSQVNLMVGACRFRELMVHYSGDPTLALAAYNSGLDSPTVRKAVTSDVRQGHPETVGYLAAAFILEQRMNKASK